MGCFSIQQGRHRAKHTLSASASSTSLSQGILKDLKTGGMPSHSNSSSNNRSSAPHYHYAPHGVGCNPYTQARSAVRSASSKLALHYSKGLSSSSFSKAQILERRGNTAGYRFGEDGPIVSHSAPISSFENEEIASFAQLFPLPLPPMAPSTATAAEDASTQSASSTRSGSSSSSCSSAPFSTCSVPSASRSYSSNANLLSTQSAPAYSVESKASSAPARPLPLPPPSVLGTSLREFSYDELAGACLNFAQEYFIRDGGAGPVFRAMVKGILDGESAVDVAVTRLSRGHVHSFKKWRAEVGRLALLSHPNICRVIGLSREDPLPASDRTACMQRERLLVYEHTSNGSLDSLLYGRKGRAPLDWGTRSRIALGAAQGLAFLHERAPRQIVYKSFKTLNIQVDHDFNAKLSDYGFAKTPRELPFQSPARSLPLDDVYAAPETRICNEITAKSNVWSFGIVLLELLTGRQNMDSFFAEEERDLLRWCRPYLLDQKRLYLVMDPELKGRYSTRKAKMIADLALQCLMDDPAARPSMRDILTSLLWHMQTTPLLSCMDTTNPSNSKAGQATMRNLNRSNSSYVRSSSYLGSGIKSTYSKSNSLASVLASPARTFTSNLQLNEVYHRPGHGSSSTARLRGFLSGEITREQSRPSIGSRDHSLLPHTMFLSGDAMDDFSEPHMRRSPSPIHRSFSPMHRSFSPIGFAKQSLCVHHNTDDDIIT